MKPYGECVREFQFSTYMILVAAFLFFLWRTIRVVYQIANYADIKKFYNTALKIDDVGLETLFLEVCTLLIYIILTGESRQYHLA